MSREKVSLNSVKDKLNYDRSAQSQANLLKYIAMFLDQREIGPVLAQNISNRLRDVAIKGTKINEVVITAAIIVEFNHLFKGTKFWDELPKQNKPILVQQVLAMSAFNTLLIQVLTKQINLTDLIDEQGFEDLTGITKLTEGQKWNLKMQEAKRRKALAKKKAEQSEVVAPIQNKTAPQPIETKAGVEEVKVHNAFDSLAQYMTEEEIKELKELNNLFV